MRSFPCDTVTPYFLPENIVFYSNFWQSLTHPMNSLFLYFSSMTETKDGETFPREPQSPQSSMESPDRKSEGAQDGAEAYGQDERESDADSPSSKSNEENDGSVSSPCSKQRNTVDEVIKGPLESVDAFGSLKSLLSCRIFLSINTVF